MRKGVFVLFVTRPCKLEIIFLYDFVRSQNRFSSFLSAVLEMEILYFSIMDTVVNMDIYKNIYR